jgi:murein DD-endopeptidase MepM/ murein hydrolase activator NlpD
MAVAGKKKRSSWLQRIRRKYRIQIISEDQFEEKASLRLSTLQVFVLFSAIIIAMVALTIYLVAFTSLREYIPGYADTSTQRKLYELTVATDSLERIVEANTLFLDNIQNVVMGRIPQDSIPVPRDTTGSYKYKQTQNTRSKEDSLLRAEVEKEDQYNIMLNAPKSTHPIGNFLFFAPVLGQVSDKYNKEIRHYGVDIVTAKNEAVKSALDGTVVLAGWTAETGYTMVIQHTENLLTVYKHNAALLKKEGTFVKAGEPIAIVGNSGELTTGPHLHFELWYNGLPVDPQLFIVF